MFFMLTIHDEDVRFLRLTADRIITLARGLLNAGPKAVRDELALEVAERAEEILVNLPVPSRKKPIKKA